MSTIESPPPAAAASGPGIVTGLKITSTLLAVGLLIQAWLGSSGFFEAETGLTTAHELLGNVFFLIAAGQAALALFAIQKGFAARPLMIVSGLLLLDVVAQLGLGYTGRDNAAAMAWHLPNGVLLMALCTGAAVLAWNVRPAQA